MVLLEVLVQDKMGRRLTRRALAVCCLLASGLFGSSFNLAAQQADAVLNAFSAAEQASIRGACSQAALSGPTSLSDCLRKKAAELKASPGMPDLSAFSPSEQSYLRGACGVANLSGAASLYGCLHMKAAELRRIQVLRAGRSNTLPQPAVERPAGAGRSKALPQPAMERPPGVEQTGYFSGTFALAAAAENIRGRLLWNLRSSLQSAAQIHPLDVAAERLSTWVPSHPTYSLGIRSPGTRGTRTLGTRGSGGYPVQEVTNETMQCLQYPDHEHRCHL